MAIRQLFKDIPILGPIANRISYCRMDDVRQWPLEKRIELLMDRYEQQMGYRMDINNPITYTEKVQWYKIFYEGDGHLDRVVDKHLFKEYVSERLGEGHTVPLLGVWTNIQDFARDWEKLPEEFCLKSNVQSKGDWVEFIHHKSNIDFKKKKKEWADWFLPKLTLINSLTRAYYNCVPKIIAEKYLENVKNQLFDYKVFCFGGEPFCIESAMERFEDGGPTFTFYDLDWNKLNVTSGNHPNKDVPRPKHLDKMLEEAKILSKDFPHVRVDFFDTEDKLYVAELTLYTGGGYSYYEPQSFNEQMGRLFNLPSSNV